MASNWPPSPDRSRIEHLWAVPEQVQNMKALAMHRTQEAGVNIGNGIESRFATVFGWALCVNKHPL